ncbi:hypothetical protein HU200_059613 [Digitaria exilis]|uniref:Uncharacterized protein n=1 Tax=Digitaria exilis TaxID=1010633 RepID=A0A835DYD7_9POAL|nr:hypothetical protein HU200_059613 [Digitaria exilis]CAB3459524.1 unnamed protein product [Digitaria exilis]
MRGSQSQRAQPLPLPLPPPPLCLPSSPAAPRRGRHHHHHRSSCSSSSSSSVSSAASTFCPSPSPSPSPRATTTSSTLVPFSWERHPGVPKNSFRLASPTGTPLPLPPPLQPATSRRRRRRRRANINISSCASSGSDPFVAAFAECTRDDDGEEDDETDHGADHTTVMSAASKDKKLWLAPARPTVSGGRGERPWRHGAGGFLGFLDLYGCKSAMAVAEGAFLARRPVASSRLGSAGRATIRPR